jgi:hypothetical protein
MQTSLVGHEGIFTRSFDFISIELLQEIFLRRLSVRQLLRNPCIIPSTRTFEDILTTSFMSDMQVVEAACLFFSGYLDSRQGATLLAHDYYYHYTSRMSRTMTVIIAARP